ncbi:MAG: hypothetical protein CV087_03320 [Candidatus Brocadia sp. WS118]|nr:MAG: hypothetical protein CV087_03320 [Candidatus Brocadia sp. WS118]
MKCGIQQQLFKIYTIVLFFGVLISIFVAPYFTYADNVAEPASSLEGQEPKEKSKEHVVKSAPFWDYSIEIPYVERIEGIAWDGKNLFALDGEKKKIHRINPISGQLVQSIVLNQKKLKGLAFDGNALWVADEEERTMIKIDPVNAMIVKTIPMEIPKDKGFDSIEGIAWDEKSKCLWVAIFAGFSSSLNQIDPDTGEIKRSVFADCYPRGIATDGEHLWTICYNRKNYPSRIDKRKIQGSDHEMFRSRALVKKDIKADEPIGLVYDGKRFWYGDRKTKSAIRFTPRFKQHVIPPVENK